MHLYWLDCFLFITLLVNSLTEQSNAVSWPPQALEAGQGQHIPWWSDCSQTWSSPQSAEGAWAGPPSTSPMASYMQGFWRQNLGNFWLQWWSGIWLHLFPCAWKFKLVLILRLWIHLTTKPKLIKRTKTSMFTIDLLPFQPLNSCLIISVKLELTL